MAIDNSTGKDKEFYDLGKKMFDRIQPITRGVPQNPQERYSKRPWVGLTDDEIDRVTDAQWGKNVNKPIYAAHRAYARAVEAASKEKNT